MRVLFAWLRASAGHPRTVAAIDQTEADWRYELGEARSPRARLAATLRALVASLRVAAMSSGRELASIPPAWLWRLFLLTGLATVLLAGEPMWRVYRHLHTVDASSRIGLCLLLVPQGLTVALGLAGYFASSMTSRRIPVLACAVLMFFATVILAGCAAPMANRAYRVLLSGALTGQGMGGARSAADLTLWSALFSAYPVNVRVVMHVLSLATAAASLLVLGAQLSRLRWRGRVTAWIGLPVVYVLLGELFSVRSLTPFLGAQAAVLLPLSLPIWGLAAAALAAASWMVSSDLRAGVRRTTPRPSER